MHAITLTEFGSPDVMQWTEVPDPTPEPGQVVVDVAATAVNRADLMQRQGKYPPPPGASEILGLECSGVISELGEGVHDWKVGDRVCALLAGGGYAEKVAVPSVQLFPIPAGLDLHAAAALPEVASTVWSNLVQFGGMRSGHTVLIHGGGSGIGTHAIQVAKALGATVAVTAGSKEKLDFCASLGADILIDYKNQDFVEELPDGADLILDNMGAKYLERNVNALAKDGKLITIGMQGGVKGELNFGALIAKRGTIHAAGLRGRPVTGPSSKADIVADMTERLWPMIEEGRVAPIVHAELPITEAAEAHRLLDADAIGKVILRVS
ncbi:NAD(P)H-quinone oxidoreductase [Rhodococcus sp. BP-252]|uniref:NAD(P)H-quinone oxidoreductase n=1 Tax=Rhodococcoides kyotonense TaxID=398843 RepID=A0A177YJE6_9NOCA|nr:MULTISPECIES: NAD(P)H-quinone oxidoreductase [Rhodococcus]MBY6410647.1 NAD(P)H-quinone oxidoreductase [Rhodococcus sp. BP-320]MBY6415528.1 NAD(P)H-quinone oxidoreductase [Rhodococcus sp. BP-321]MBY6420143.1 NAD(P)H-quinone oxidoreductase [Rhodococcus sp. BP-324]MBY6425203.1 NAD(P)H-quinone oxidoreductase [Rhodococcus sp. BP-323]MBY6430734.1 NAD(P)H-quinone oxidoreductase [Rhodococcus sp. BP-322]